MPNWAVGYIWVKGKPKDVKNFCKLFVFEDKADKEDSKKGQKFFARSFIHENWKDFNKNIKGKSEVEFLGDFAWSGWSCLIDGYPTKDKQENPEGFGDCVTLEWACKKYNVEVEITTEEEGCCFEEEIKADKNGVKYNSKDMPAYTCQKCGNEQSFPSDYNDSELEDCACDECGEEGVFVDKLKRMIEKRIENARM